MSSVGLWSAATGMRANQMRINNIANNLANVSTTGFKRSRVSFEDLMYQTYKYPGASETAEFIRPGGIQIGLGTNPVSTQKIFDQGSLKHTGGDFDLAIEGAGFFQVLLPDGTIGYTRDGSFRIDAEGRIVTQSGLPLVPEIYVPVNAQHVTIGKDGTVSVTIPGQSQSQVIGQIQLASFTNPSGLVAIGGNLLIPSAASGEPIVGEAGIDGMGTLAHGYLEMSNVDAVEEMIALIEAQRAYEMSSKSIQTQDSLLQIAAQLKR